MFSLSEHKTNVPEEFVHACFVNSRAKLSPNEPQVWTNQTYHWSNTLYSLPNILTFWTCVTTTLLGMTWINVLFYSAAASLVGMLYNYNPLGIFFYPFTLLATFHRLICRIFLHYIIAIAAFVYLGQYIQIGILIAAPLLFPIIAFLVGTAINLYTAVRYDLTLDNFDWFKMKYIASKTRIPLKELCVEFQPYKIYSSMSKDSQE